MIFRVAAMEDIPQIQIVRHAVKENILSDPSLVTDQDCTNYLTVRGKGWVCEVDGKIVGFAIADLLDNNIWALFLKPEFEKQGIGKNLHNLMLDWYFSQQKDTVWLSTTPETRADGFYRKHGWAETGKYGTSQIRFEMTYENWSIIRGKPPIN